MAKLNNGKLIDGRYHRGEEIIIAIPKGRRPAYIQGKVVKNLDPRKNYSPEDLERIRVMPDRSKGGFFRTRSDFSKKVIRDQIFAVSKYLFKGNTDIDFDDKRYDWMTITRYVLPDGWTPSVSALMILFPTEYPSTPPIGFYLPDWVKSPHGHLYDAVYHNADSAPLKKGWKWYCAYVNPGSWQPACGRYVEDWKRGDNLFDYITLVGEVLASGG